MARHAPWPVHRRYFCVLCLGRIAAGRQASGPGARPKLRRPLKRAEWRRLRDSTFFGGPGRLLTPDEWAYVTLNEEWDEEDRHEDHHEDRLVAWAIQHNPQGAFEALKPPPTRAEAARAEEDAEEEFFASDPLWIDAPPTLPPHLWGGGDDGDDGDDGGVLDERAWQPMTRR